MADELKNKENLLIITDEQNILYLDPNATFQNGQVKQRMVSHENLVMYVNLEAEIIPRSRVYLGGDINKEKTQIISLYKGNINFLKPAGSDYFDTSWTELYTDQKDPKTTFYSSASQNFGIKSISVKNMYKTPPQVQIIFIDVRGKTLYESPHNSPYKAFFHLPVPIFYLTIKGFYGKAIRLEIHLTKFNTRFDSTTGNFEITCDFIGTTAALLADLPIQYALVAPYMYPQEIRTQQGTKQQGSVAGQTSFVDMHTTKGFELLKQVYDEYKAKGIIPEDFPYITLRDLLIKAEKLDHLLETKFFNQIISTTVLSDMDEYGDKLNFFANNIISWGKINLEPANLSPDDKNFYSFSKINENKVSDNLKLLQSIIDSYTDPTEGSLVINAAFGQKRTSDFKNKDIVPPIIPVFIKKNYILNSRGKTYVNPQAILDQIKNFKKIYVQSRSEIETKLGEQINKEIKSNKDNGIGFSPTIRNVFAVILAGVDVFIRLMNDVHQNAIESAEQRSKLIGDQLEGLFPFPQIVRKGSDTKPVILVYPGDSSVSANLHADDYILWPEVEFVEEYLIASSQLREDLINKEIHLNDINTIFPQDDTSNLHFSETITWDVPRSKPYEVKTNTAILYELYERTYVAAKYSGLESVNSLKSLGKLEAKNVLGSIQGITNIQQKLKSLKTLDILKTNLFNLSPYKRWENTKDELFTTSYLRTTQQQDFDLIPWTAGSTNIESFQYSDYTSIINELSNYTPNITHKSYPFVDSSFYQFLQGKTSGSTMNILDYSISQILNVDISDAMISNSLIENNWYKGSNPTNIFLDCNLPISGTTINIFNTPYFNNAISKDIDEENFKRSSYLFLNALPYINLYNKFINTNNYVCFGFNQVAALHKIPYLFAVKLGSIWHRYKEYQNGRDLFSGVFDNNSPEKLFDTNTSLNLTLNINGIVRNVSSIDNNVGFYPDYHEKIFNALNGSSFYNFSAHTLSNYQSQVQAKINAGSLKFYEPLTNNANIDYFTTYAALSNSGGIYNYFLFPSSSGLFLEKFNSIRAYQNETVRYLWFDTKIAETNFSGFTYPGYNEYFRNISDVFSLSNPYIKIYDLLATFKPAILDSFETEYLSFSSNNTLSLTFKSILSQLLNISSTNANEFLSFSSLQKTVAEKITKQLTDQYYQLKIGNPKEIDIKTLKDFIANIQQLNLNKYDPSQLTSGNTANLNMIIGEDLKGYYLNFYQTFNLSYTADYFTKFRMLAKYYAGLKHINDISKNDFITTVQDLIANLETKQDQMISTCFTELNKIKLDESVVISKGTVGHNDSETLKLELYNSFKTLNDRWIGGTALIDKTIMDDFLFIDRANRDIGQKTYVNLFKLQDLLDERNKSMSLYGLIGDLLQGSGFIFFALPAYVNFYGINQVGNFTEPKYTTLQVAEDLFGTFLEVDYTESSPKFLCQYTGLSSKYLNMNGVSDEFKFNNDSFDISKTANNPIASTPESFKTGRYDKSNRVVCFEINFGDQSQSIFKSISLDQAQIKNTSEAYSRIEEMSKSNSGSNATQADISLFNIYQNRNYTCEVICMGNVMIQPSMYFYLKNIPMFEGTYLITEVNHNIDGNNIETKFTGTRVPIPDLPDLEDILISTNKVIYQRLLNTAKTTTNG